MAGESKFTRKLCKDLVKCGAVVQVQSASHFSSGWPDRIVTHPLWHGQIELKGIITVVTERQAYNMSMLWSRKPGCVYVVRAPGILISGADSTTELGSFGSARELLQDLHDLQEKWDNERNRANRT